MQDRFFYFKSLPDVLGLYNNHTNTDGEAVQFRDGVRWIRVSEFGSYKYKGDFDATSPWKKVMIRRFGFQGLPTADLMATSGGIKINAKKLMDIKKQIPYIPVSYRPFYTSLVSSDVIDTSDSEDAGSPVEAEESTRAKNSNPKKRLKTT